MRKSATILTIAALGAMMAVGSATESMARGHGGGGRHDIFRSHHGFAGHHGFHGHYGHVRNGFHRGHFRHFGHHDYYWGNPYYSCGFPFLFGGGDPYYCR